jgi:hypothetical protein
MRIRIQLVYLNADPGLFSRKETKVYFLISAHFNALWTWIRIPNTDPDPVQTNNADPCRVRIHNTAEETVFVPQESGHDPLSLGKAAFPTRVPICEKNPASRKCANALDKPCSFSQNWSQMDNNKPRVKARGLNNFS